MLNRTWRIVLLIVTLIAILWPSILGNSTMWIALIAVVLLLLGEITCKTCMPEHKTGEGRVSGKTVRKTTKKKRR
ncbi:MAG: hypothetical protein Q8P57_00550 [Candidatus Pacearchaeota archaeon]|nr:hypothetical protein [Candidatus Pacearchaeota archaeon]